MIPRFRSPLPPALALAALLAARPAAGQVVVARVVADETDTPVVGALAHLVGPEGRVVRSTLTDEIGRAVFVDAPEGDYRIRTEMIGRAPHESPSFRVQGGAAHPLEIRLRAAAITLEGIEVRGEERCRIRPEEGLAVGRVWEEARRALEGASYTDRAGLYRYRTVLFERDLDAEARAVLGERSREREAWQRVPFASLPTRELVAEGFASAAADGGRLYHAPDAGVLLSDEFLDAHCFRLHEGDDPALIGLRFEPVGRLPRGYVDIGGTLWVARATGELAWLEYRYLNLPPDESTPLVGGRVDFRRMPDGTWIVPEWWIRMPRVVRELRASGPRDRVGGYRVTGGRVLEVRSRKGERVLRGRDAGAIEGFVQDSLGLLPLQGVRVGVAGSGQLVFTDEEGRFRLTNLGEGIHEVRFIDARLEAFGLTPPSVHREVRVGEVTSVFYRMPSVAELLFEACRHEAPPEGTAVLGGVVRGAPHGEPLEGVLVRVRWERFRMSGQGADRRIDGADVEGFETHTDARGRYRFCAVPEDRLLTLELARAGPAVVADTLRVPPFAGGVVRTLEWGP